MLIPNRDASEHAQILSRLEHFSAECRLDAKESGATSGEGSLAGRLRASRRELLFRRVESLALVGGVARYLFQSWRKISDPRLTRREKLRAIPLFGHAVVWLWGLLTLVRFKEEALALMRQSQRETEELKARLKNLHQALERERTKSADAIQQLADLMGRLRAAESGVQDTSLPAEFYLAFENEFRGSMALIRRRLSAYLPHLQSGMAASGIAKVIDVGCGRGEWLEILQEQGFSACGVDLSSAMVAKGQARGLDVTEADGIAHLLSLQAGSYGGVTSFHLVEHLSPGDLLALIAAAYRVLAPGGVLILETPNPENLQVAAYSFYMDPTHRNPLPPPLLDFIARYRGFVDIEVVRINPWSEYDPEDPHESPALHKLMYCEQDYAIVARKPGQDHQR